ncbi:hypothetical protein EB796_009191 [Bugula neritina]|uniref:Active regulator of SIRT1 n=1 Tax=Bugula neritina TaxID=10212 RepID=A0A7J7K1S3_BUGNE|nr:hypothetical protein EB796_009191 [Bugula neritina]
MSHSLIRRGLDLYKDDLQGNTDSSRKISHCKQKLTEKELIKMVGTNKKGFRRKLKRLQAKQNATTLKDKKLKSQPDLYESYTRHDNTDSNIKALNLMRLLNKDEQKVIAMAAEKHEAKSSKQRRRKSDKNTSASDDTTSSSVFTEEDFQKFFKEYNFT